MRFLFKMVCLAIFANIACQPTQDIKVSPLPVKSSPSPSPSVLVAASLSPPSMVNASQEISQEYTNLLANSGSEVGVGDVPQDWARDSWGELTPVFKWATDQPFSDQRYLSVSVQDYQEGDAKWIPTPQYLESGSWYEYSDAYRSDGRTRYIWFCQNRLTDKRINYVAWQSHTSSQWRKETFRFFIPFSEQCLVSVMHVLDRNGYLHTDEQKLVKSAPHPLRRPMLSITFDDVWTTAATVGARELENRGMKGSFYVSRNLTLSGEPGFAPESLIPPLIKSGHEVGTHSAAHRRLSTFTPEKIDNDLDTSILYLKDMGANVNGIAYPHGDFDHTVESAVKTRLQYARTSIYGLNDATTDPYRLRVLPVTVETTTKQLLDAIENAEKTSSWLIFLFHDLGTPDGSNIYTTSMQQFVQILNRIQEKGLPVVTVEEGVKELNR